MAVQLFDPIWNAKLRPLEKLVLLKIADRVNGQEYAAFLNGTRTQRPGARPGLASLAKECGMTKQGVANTLKRIQALEVLRVDEGRGRHARTYFINEDALRTACSVPPGRTRRVPPGRTQEPASVPSHGTQEQPADGSEPRSLRPMASEFASHAVPVCVPPGGTEPVLTGETGNTNRRDAAERSDEVGKTPEKTEPPFKVYAAIATRAIECSLVDDRSDNLGNMKEWFKRLCAQQAIPYNPELAGKAVEAGMAARAAAKAGYLRGHAAIAGRKAM